MFTRTGQSSAVTQTTTTKGHGMTGHQLLAFGEDGATENVPCRLLLFYHQKGENNEKSGSVTTEKVIS